MYEALKQIVENIRRQMRWVSYLELINIVNILDVLISL